MGFALGGHLMTRRRPGFSLVEVVVAIAVVAVLAGLLIPAVQRSRESARRLTCQNGLRQIGAAVLLHEGAQRRLPALYGGSFLPQPRSAQDEFRCHSWRSALLPHLEQAGLFAALNFQLLATHEANQTALNQNVAVLLCPSNAAGTRNLPDLVDWPDITRPPRSVGTAAICDYEAVGGVRVGPTVGTSANLGNIRFGAWGEPSYDPTNGASLRYRVARLGDITDGTSQTLLIGERAGRPDLYRRGKPVDRFPYREPGNATDSQQAAWGVSTHFLWLVHGPDQRVNDTNGAGLYSFHPGGANVGFADGSVRFLGEGTSPTVLRALATRAGGEAD